MAVTGAADVSVRALDLSAPSVAALEDFYRGIEALEAIETTTLERLREGFEHWGDVGFDPAGVDYAHAEVGGVPGLWATPAGAAEDRVLLCMHGGGYAAGSIYSHRKLYAHLARAVGCRAFIVNYRMAPEHVHPAPVQDVFAVYRALLESGIGADHLALTGDSAGGALCFSTLLLARDARVPMPAAILPLSPWVELEAVDPTFQTNTRDLIATRDVVIGSGDVFVGSDGDRRDPLAAPIYAELTGFPPIFMQAGGCENFVATSRTLLDHARAAGVDARLEVVEDMQHVFQLMAGASRDADTAIARLAEWVRPRLGLTA